MKALNDTQKNIIIASYLNAGKTMAQAEARIKEKEEKMNKPKKQSFDWVSFNEDDGGLM